MEFGQELPGDNAHPAENIPGNQNVQNHQQHRRNQRLQQNVEALMHLANNNVIHALGGQFLIRNSKLLDIALRLPPLFLMDQILLYDMGLNYFASPNLEPDKSPVEPKIHFTYTNKTDSILDSNMTLDQLQAYSDIITSLAFYHFASFMLCFNLFWFSMLWVSLTTRQLVSFYTYLLAFATVPLSYLLNSFTVSYILASDPMVQLPFSLLSTNLDQLPLQLIMGNYVSQYLLGFLLSRVLSIHVRGLLYDFRGRTQLLHRLLTIPVLIPTSLALLGAASGLGSTFNYSSVISIIPAAIISLFILSKVIGGAVRSVIQQMKAKRQFILNFGFNTFLEAEWVRLRIPSLLRTFWLTRMSQQLISIFVQGGLNNQQLPYSDAAARAALAYMLEIGRDLITRGAETLIALLGMTSVVSKLCHYVGSFFHLLLSNAAAENEEEKSVASVSAILFFILALQTGLTSLEPEKRFSRICKNLCLLLTALFHFIHNNVSPVLMSLTAGQKSASDIKKHIRALSICLFLILASMSLMIILWKWFTIGTWLLAVSAFCIEVVVKVLVTVSVYGLFLYDSRVREGTWEGLDDAVYYVKAVGNTVEFCFAVFLFFNGGWILFFESGGTIRAVMMVVHAYFNIWCEAKTGWKTFMKRRTAVAKINSLPFATEEELTKHDDVCAICYMEMTSAKITRCRHFFHSVCLRKWLYMQDTCPLCHAVLYKDQSEKAKKANAAAVAGAAATPNAEADTNENNNSDSSSEDQDTSDEDDVLDHDDPPYQAPPIIEAVVEADDESSDTNSEDDNDDLEAGRIDSSASESTRLSSTGSGEDEDLLFDDDDNHEDLIRLMEHDSDLENDDTGSDSTTSSQGIDR